MNALLLDETKLRPLLRQQKPGCVLPVFINGQGPFLLRDHPARLLRLPMRTAYALVRAATCPRLTWPPYTPRADWTVRAASNAYYDADLDLSQIGQPEAGGQAQTA